MYKHTLIIAALVLAIVAGVSLFTTEKAQAPIVPVEQQACTKEAMVCPDGSAALRTGPNCEFATCPVATATSTNSIAIGASATINGTTIGVLELVEDSRCPVDVQCIQAGRVRVRASIDSYNKDFTFTLGESQVVGNATITLVSVVPVQKFATQTVQPSAYRFTFTVVPKVTVTPPGGGKMCTMDAKLCPDGSYVGRTGPNCTFAACPNTSGVRGTVLLGPTCPVMRDPPDPQCADKPYATTVVVRRTGSSAMVTEGKSDANGEFEFALAPGSYTLTATGGTMLPRCNETSVLVVPNVYVSTAISCDTGIR